MTYKVRDDSTRKFVFNSGSIREATDIAKNLSNELLHVMYIIRDRNGKRCKVRKIVMNRVVTLAI